MGELRKVVGASIRRHRTAKGLTQAQLAEAIGRSVDLLSRIERGESAPSFETIEALFQKLGVTPAELFGGQPADQAPLSPELASTVRFLEDATDKEARWLSRLLAAARDYPRET